MKSCLRAIGSCYCSNRPHDINEIKYTKIKKKANLSVA